LKSFVDNSVNQPKSKMKITMLFHRSGGSAERRQFEKMGKCGFLPEAATPVLQKFPKMFAAALLLLLVLSGGCATHAWDKTDASLAPVIVPPDAVGITDAEIFDVVARVARHQIVPLADGDYPAVTNLDAARAAREPAGIEWNYPRGVALYGMLRSTDLTGDKNVSQFVVQHDQICARYYGWLAGLEKQFGKDGSTFARGTKIKGLIGLGSLDSCGAMGNQFLEGMLRRRAGNAAGKSNPIFEGRKGAMDLMSHPEPVASADKAVVERIADWVVNRQDRLPDGTLWRSNSMGGTVWPDDLYMGGVFLVRYGIYTGDRKYIDDAANNIIHQAALEQDSDGLWFHGYFESNKMHAPFKWGRGNGWVTVTLVETLSAMPENDPRRPQLLEILRKQLDGLKKVQAPDGIWRQVLDKPELWEETSCTAMFAYGIARAVNRGWIDATNMAVARQAFAGIAKNVTPDGVVNGTCEGTGIGQSLDFYIRRRQPVDDPHGRGPVMLAGTEILVGGKE
jgi:rhamnogalacturonyl hydrolase YesR